MSASGWKVRLGVAAAAIAGLAVVALLAVALVGGLVTRQTTGADPASALNEDPLLPDDREVEVVWRPDAADTGRAMEPATRRLIERDHVRAWRQLGLSHEAGEAIALDTYFTGPGLDGVSEAVEAGALAALDVHAHDLHLRTYSADGQIIAYEDRVLATRTVRTPSGLVAETTLDTYDVVAVLEDGTWRIRHLVRTASEPASTS